MDREKGRKSDQKHPNEPEVTAVSRSGRIIKRSSKLLGFESSDLPEEKEKTPKSSKQSSKRQSANHEPLDQFNENDNSMEFLEDQQHTESGEWTLDTKDCDDTEPSGTSVSVGEHNQFMYALKNLNMKEPGFVAYALWAKEVRKTLMNAYPNFSTSQINQQLRDMWKSVPTEDKSRWVRKAKRLLEREGLIDNSTNDTKITVKKPSAEIIDNSIDTSNKNKPKLEPLRSTQPIDVAAHLALLGESLGIIGQRLKEHQGQIAVNGSVSVLLDSLLCALGPLLCLTQQVTEINVNSQETMSRLMDDIAYIMPGL
ncbi:HMG box-containing protein 4 isoform X1 [Metopolophium dirhodum]|uniref:HMG box-containing protein 4 isoform X1 n=1 Tax=Metopolophium dirhodum TaxID=44670 RepID=UPI002990097A|nr:HMG box-containing protein 4 isoform X1 [Metopolophium dirhodum]